MMTDKKRIVSLVYFLLTLLAVPLWIYEPSTNGIHVVGCHATIYLFLLTLLIGDYGAITLARICFIFWPVYAAAFLVCSILAIWKKRYMPIGVLAIIDVAVSILVMLRYFEVCEFSLCVLSFLGVCQSLYVTIVLLSPDKSNKA